MTLVRTELRQLAWITVGAFFVVRVLTIRFNWRTRSVWEEESGSGGL